MNGRSCTRETQEGQELSLLCLQTKGLVCRCLLELFYSWLCLMLPARYLYCFLSFCISGDVPLPERLHGKGRGYGARCDGADPELLGLLRSGLPYASPHGVSPPAAAVSSSSHAVTHTLTALRQMLRRRAFRQGATSFPAIGLRRQAFCVRVCSPGNCCGCCALAVRITRLWY